MCIRDSIDAEPEKIIFPQVQHYPECVLQYHRNRSQGLNITVSYTHLDVYKRQVDVVFCVPAIDIIPVVEATKGTNIQVGAENMYFEEKGAYTGEISPAMLVDAGVKYVVLGHSERREYFGETNEDVNKKVLKAFEHGITPIMCCGETLTQREQGVTMDFIRQQVKVGFQGVTADQAKTCLLYTSRCV